MTRSLLPRLLMRWEGALVLVVILELIVFSAINPRFLEPLRLLNSTTDFVYLGIIALPLAMVMMTGGIDISIGSIVSLSAIVTGVCFANGMNIWLAAGVGMLAAVIAGLVNGIAILVTGANPMVITLGSQFLFAGLAIGISGLANVSSFEGISGLPDDFVNVASGSIGPVPNLLIIFAVVAALFVLLIHCTTFGRQVRLIGANPKAARYAGFSMTSVTIRVYLLTAIGSGLVGILLTSYLSSARADIGADLLMPTLTLVVIGGISMFGGEGTAAGVIVATFVVGLLQQGLRFAGMTEPEVAVATGTVLVLAAALRWWASYGAEMVRNRRVRRQEHHRIAADPSEPDIPDELSPDNGTRQTAGAAIPQ